MKCTDDELQMPWCMLTERLVYLVVVRKRLLEPIKNLEAVLEISVPLSAESCNNMEVTAAHRDGYDSI